MSVPYTIRRRHPEPQLADLQVPIAVALLGRTKASQDPSAGWHRIFPRHWAGPAAHAAHAVLEPLAELRGPAGPVGTASVATVLRNANLSSDMSPSLDDPADPLAAVAAHASVVPAIFALAVFALVAFVPVPSAPEAFAPAVCTVPQLVAVARLATAAAAAALRVDAALASGHCCRSQGEVPARAAQLLVQHPALQLRQRSLCYLVEGQRTARACADRMDQRLAFPARDILGHCVVNMGPDSSGSREWSNHHQLDHPRQGPAKQC